VVFFLHGVTGTESADAAGFSSHVARGIAAGAIPPVLVVFPNGGLSGYRGKVEEMIVDELVPLIDRTYPTLARAESRAVVGFSMGGSGAIWLAVAHPGLFAAAVSWAGSDDCELERLLAKNAPGLAKRGFGMLLVNGEKDNPDGFRDLLATCRRFGVRCTTTRLPGVAHDLGAYYAQSSQQVMAFLGEHLKR
jgi:pimeloyl-ACP methyl ester carboxylesterase